MIPAATKKVIIIIATVAIATLLVGIAIAELVPSPETAKDSDKVTNQTEPSFYEQAYAKATSEQKPELDRIIADTSQGVLEIGYDPFSSPSETCQKTIPD